MYDHMNGTLSLDMNPVYDYKQQWPLYADDYYLLIKINGIPLD
jgi:hypothetical protein